MSGFKTILVPVGDAASGKGPLEFALRLAADFSSHMIGLHVRVDPATAVPLMGEGMSGAIVEDLMQATQKQAASRAKAARQAFDEACARHGATLTAGPPAEGVTAEWIDVTGREEEVVAARGRLSDVVVLGRPGGEADMPSPITLNAALMESGRPLLLVPPEPPAVIGHSVAIAWNGSAEAGRAVAFAMPLLQRAAAVHILSVSEEMRAGNAPAEELAAYLGWHGIAAQCHALPAGASHAGDSLMAACRDLGADLLVMGAYTHSRLRQLILGGVTRHVLHHAPLPCLMSH
ncbi:MAG: universal stress protein [Magnetospirillum sp.]|nr:universal stress protein [Magnetospirillum sp.]